MAFLFRNEIRVLVNELVKLKLVGEQTKEGECRRGMDIVGGYYDQTTLNAALPHNDGRIGHWCWHGHSLASSHKQTNKTKQNNTTHLNAKAAPDWLCNVIEVAGELDFDRFVVRRIPKRVERSFGVGKLEFRRIVDVDIDIGMDQRSGQRRGKDGHT